MRVVRDWCRHFLYGNVPADHRCDAKIVLVGEAPGTTEVRKGRPFCGESGKLLEEEIWNKVGLTRNDFYITNVLPYRPLKTNPLTNEPKTNIARGVSSLKSRLTTRLRPHLIVPVGNLALYALMGHSGIMKWRGSILQASSGIKVIPTIHPAAVLRSWSLIKTVTYDWEKIKRESSTPTITRPARSLIAVTSKSDVRLQSLLSAPKLAVDIEVDRASRKILCVAFATSPSFSVSIDTRYGNMDIVKELCENSAVKIFQKGSFDVFVLRGVGIHVRNFTQDTTLMYHAFDNNVGPTTQKDADEQGGKSIIKPYSLAYMASIFTDEPYWKESAKDEGSGEPYGAWKSNWLRFQEYNARDAAVTYEIAERLEIELRAIDRWDWYLDQYASLIKPLLDLSLHGVRFDSAGASRELETISGKLSEMRKYLVRIEPSLIIRHRFKKQPKVTGERHDGTVIHGAEYGIDEWIKVGKSISGQALMSFLRTKLMLKNVKSVDEISIRQLILRIKEQVSWKGLIPLTQQQTLDLLLSVLEYRKLESKSKFLQSKSVDADGRVRSEYSMLIQTGRLSSSKNPNGTGMNLQNQKRDIRHFYIPDHDDWYLLSIDYSQAEDLVVKALSDSPDAMKLVNAVQEKSLDIHKRLAKLIFATEDIDYAKRYVAKRARHAGNYGMQAERFQQVLLKDGFVMSMAECRRILEATDAADPWVKVWQYNIRRTIQQHRRLVTSWGWQLDFTYERLRDTGTFRRGYAFIPQSEVGVSMKQYGLRYMHGLIARKNLQSRINMLVHDELVLSCPRKELYGIAKSLTKSLQTPRTYSIRSFIGESIGKPVQMWIPTDLTISKTLKCLCGNCAKPLTLDNLLSLSKEEFYQRLDEWESKATT